METKEKAEKDCKEFHNEWDKDNEEMLKNNIKMKIEKLLKLRNEILKESININFNEKNCPLNTVKPNDSDDYKLDHYSFSQLFYGLGRISWICPFCNKYFCE